MEKSKRYLLIRAVKAIHYIVSVLLFIWAWLHYKATNSIVLAFRYNLFVIALYACVFLFFIRVYNAYSIEYSSSVDCALSLSLSAMISILLLYIIPLIAWKKYYPIRSFLILMGIQIVWNFLWASIVGWIYSVRKTKIPTAIIYCSETNARRMENIRGFKKRFKITKFVENPESVDAVIKSLGDCRAVVIADMNRDLRDNVLLYCARKGIHVFLYPSFGDTILMSGVHMETFSVPLIRVWPDIRPEYMLVKRGIDIIISALAIVITSPVMLITALCIRNYDKGPAIYRQVRLTRGGREFQILKFRSMKMDAEADGIARLSSGEDDDRVTPIGQVIRKFRLDELPQLFNVLKGDMSLIGPRPERPELAKQYEEILPEFNLRLSVKAGITGCAQVYGKYNSDPYEKLQMDILYINRMSFFLDFRLLFATVRVLFMKESTAGVKKGRVTALEQEE